MTTIYVSEVVGGGWLPVAVGGGTYIVSYRSSQWPAAVARPRFWKAPFSERVTSCCLVRYQGAHKRQQITGQPSRSPWSIGLFHTKNARNLVS